MLIVFIFAWWQLSGSLWRVVPVSARASMPVSRMLLLAASQKAPSTVYRYHNKFFVLFRHLFHSVSFWRSHCHHSRQLLSVYFEIPFIEIYGYNEFCLLAVSLGTFVLSDCVWRELREKHVYCRISTSSRLSPQVRDCRLLHHWHFASVGVRTQMRPGARSRSTQMSKARLPIVLRFVAAIERDANEL